MNEKTETEKYIRPKEASDLLKVTCRTLLNWDYKGQIKIKAGRTKGGHRRYLLSDILSLLPEKRESPKRNICYCRVSTSSQKEDLERQFEYFSNKYPDHEIIKDIGSGLNFKRRGFNSILDAAIKGDIGEIVVTHKDRLCRFGFELVERIVKKCSDGHILVLDQKKTSPQEELANDIISIITVFSSRLHGLRSNSIKKQLKRATIKNAEIEIVSE